MKPARAFAPVVVALVALAGCAGDSGPAEESAEEFSEAEAPAFTESEATTKAAYTLRDYKFEGPATVKGPKVFFTAENEGSEDHELEVLDAQGEALGEIEAFAPGTEAAAFAAQMPPGTYTLQCILTTGGGQSHKDLGMNLTLTVE